MPVFTFKNASNAKETFELDLELGESITSVKSKLQEKGLDPALTKLIASGKNMEDGAKTLGDYQVKTKEAGGFIVYLQTKPKPAAAPAAAPAAPAPAVAAPAAEAPAAAVSAGAASAAAAPSAAAPAAGGNPFAGPSFDVALEGLKSMGLTTDEAAMKAALIAARGNPNVAVDYLLSGIPPGALEKAMAGGGKAASGAPKAPKAAAPSGAPPSGAHVSTLIGGPLYALRTHPQIGEMRRAVAANPQVIQQLVSLIVSQSTELGAAINANMEGFLSLLNEKQEEEEEEGEEFEEEGGEGEEGDEGDEGGMALPPEMQALMAQIASLPPAQQQAAITQIATNMGIPPAALMGALGGAMGMGGAPGGGALPAGAVRVELTQEQGAQIEAIIQQGKDMGFEWPKQKVLQAYLVCDKNMELTVNYLLSND